TEDHTIYAQWVSTRYTLTLDGNGGTYRRTTYTWWGPQTTYEPTTTKTITYNSAYGTMEEPEREGYTFAGWNTKQNGTGETITSATIVNRLENHTIYAQWQINQYTITFDSNGGSAVAPITQDYGTTITAPADPTREGYTFTGWSEEIPSTMPAESITVTAQWRINQYTITFDSNGGSTVAPITQDYGTTITAPADPTREGYTFAGWSEEIPATMPATDKTITASWTINSYTITFDSNGGSAVAPITQDYGTTITAPADPTREGYTFAGWSEEIPATMPATDKTLTANWTKNKYNYTIEYYYENLLDVPNKVELNGKYFTKNRTEISADEYEYESEITTFVDNNTILGYELFAIRPVDSENNLLLVIGDTAAGAENVIKVYYNLASYTATFNGNGGTPATSSIEKTYGEALGTLPTVTREGYTFAGWYTESTGGTKITEATTMPLNGATYYAHWNAVEYTANFNGNGGTDGASITKGYGKALGTLPTSTRDGYTFAGWFTESTGGTPVTETTTMPLNGATYYAHWNAVEYTANFNGNGGTDGASITKGYGEALGTLPTSTRDGYTFAGWYTESTGGTPVTEATTMPLNGATYYAHWDEETFDVTFVIGVDGDYSKKPDNPRISATIDSSSISIGSSYTIQLKNSEVLEYTASADYYHPISNGSGTLTNITEDTTIYINFTLNNEVQGHTTFNLNTSTTKLGKRISGYYTIDYAAISGSIYDIVNYFVIDEPSAYELDKVTKIDNLVIQGKNEATVVHWTAEQNIKTAIGDSIHFEDVYTLGDYSDPGYTVNCTTTFSSPISLKGKTLELTIDQLNVYCNLKQITINYWYIPKNV
ncbi:MAG: InlB B-repeat-containing protein, partial [Clostridia bacterium]|nr:InlB B-repeat-containing protein [Clostridia bacterium]